MLEVLLQLSKELLAVRVEWEGCQGLLDQHVARLQVPSLLG